MRADDPSDEKKAAEHEAPLEGNPAPVVAEVEVRTRPTDLVLKPTGDVDPVQANDCLVVIHTEEAALLGKRFVLDFTPVRIGRGADNHLVLEGDSVSRRHTHLEQRGSVWWLVDDRSTNGTYVNEEQISGEYGLTNGDRIKIGPTVFKYLSGDDVEARYHEEIYRLTIVDGLTQAHTKVHFLRELRERMSDALGAGVALSLLLVDADHFKAVNDRHGHLAGDLVLCELARLISSQLNTGSLLARTDGDEFAVILPKGSEAAITFAEALRASVESAQFVFQGDTISIRVSIGLTTVDGSTRATSSTLLRDADARLYEAKRTGRNRVVGAEGGRGLRRPIAAEALIERGRAHGGSILAFELEDAEAFRAAHGTPAYERHLVRLMQGAERGIGDDGTLALWQDRIVLLTVPGSGDAGVVAASVESAYRRTTEAVGSTPRLGVGIVAFEKLGSRRGAEAIDYVLGALVAVRPAALPVPLALHEQADARGTSESRCTALCNTLERGLAFLAAAELAAASTPDNASNLREIIASFGQRDLTLGGWHEVAIRLAPLVPIASFISGSALQLRDGNGPTEWSKTIEGAIRVRNELAHGAGRDPDAYGDAERTLRAGVDALQIIAAPLGTHPFVSLVAGSVEHIDDDLMRYDLWELHGLTRTFKRRTFTTAWKLRKDWCYLLDGDNRPLLLAPLFFARICALCNEREVAWVRRIVVGAPGLLIKGKGLMTDHPLECELPADKTLALLAPQ